MRKQALMLEQMLKRLVVPFDYEARIALKAADGSWGVELPALPNLSAQERLEQETLRAEIATLLTGVLEPGGLFLRIALDTKRSGRRPKARPMWKHDILFLLQNPRLDLRAETLLERLALLAPLVPAAPPAGGPFRYTGMTGSNGIFMQHSIDAAGAAAAAERMQFASVVNAVLRTAAIPDPRDHIARNVERIEDPKEMALVGEQFAQRLAAVIPTSAT